MKVEEGGREDEGGGYGEEEEEGEGVEVKKVCFHDVLRFRNETTEVLGGHVWEENNGKVKFCKDD